MRHRILLVLWVGLLWVSVEGIWASPPNFDEVPTYVVQPGETLSAIAQRYRTDVTTLLRLNALHDPRAIYVGQQLYLAPEPVAVDVRDWELRARQVGETFSLLARRSGVDWETLATANQLLNPESLLVGAPVLMPPQEDAQTLAIAGDGDTWLGLALRDAVNFWELVSLNPTPLYPGEGILFPGEGPSDYLPYPIVALQLGPQPIIRGQTAVVELETVEPVTCDVVYLGNTQPCYAETARHLYALVSLSPMLEPDVYTMKLHVRTATSEITFDLPLTVNAGRFSFEHIDIPAGRQQLFDPVLLQSESDKVDAMANIHSPERHWQVPFECPVNAAVSSYFGSRRSYGGAYNSYHAGVDFRASTGVQVHVPAAGRVILAEPLTVRGNAIIIDHGWGVLTGYWHLSQIDVEEGQQVEKDQVIGRVGNTGLSTGSHLHWQLWVDGTPVDPLQWVEPFYDFPLLVPSYLTGAD